ncbi:Lysine exporter protein (LYSE/YGGA) [Desulfovibrio sp. X2]|uniref:LysE family translocator n=1 Tax=Desulfovibrio sp. X2 TaxID=941449 RepID=UPI0003589FF9|nr:LysE family translocator [Desulfovibrio sp. X2]EPR38655.1 Lysine exporter protein (LYSE/YGGA) [Desulfovibrio sp. X2]
MLEHLGPFIIFVVLMTGTPGPANLTLLAIGQSTGFRSGLPFLLGCFLGMGLLNCVGGLGLGQLVAASPAAGLVLKVAGTAYIVYLGVKILGMQIGEARTTRRFTFLEGVMLHPLSPKSLAMSLTGAAQFMTPGRALLPQVGAFVLIFLVSQATFHTLWLTAGSSLLKLLRSQRVLTACNVSAATLMVGATVWALFA